MPRRREKEKLPARGFREGGSVNDKPVHYMLLLIGAPGSGKTSLVEQFALDAIQAKRQVRILDPSNQFPEGYLPDGVKGEWPGVDAVDFWLQELLASDFHGLLILDDADRFLPKQDKRGSPWRDLFVAFRHYRLDIVINTRRVQEVTPVARSNASHLALFRLRSHRAREAISDEVGVLVECAPKEPFLYSLVDVDHEEWDQFATTKRDITLEADEDFR